MKDQNEITLFSPFGGLVVLVSPKAQGVNTIKFTLENVVEAPRFDLTDNSSLSQWTERYLQCDYLVNPGKIIKSVQYNISFHRFIVRFILNVKYTTCQVAK